MKKRKILVLALLLAGSTVPHFVQADNVSNDAPEVSAGVLRGRVVNSHRDPLSGATVVIEALNKTAITDENGYYIMQGITGGDYDVTVNYLGYEPLSTSVSLPERGTTEKNLVLSELTTLQEVVVRGAFSGQHKAINMQKNNLGVTNVISAEQVGKFPDSNIGDALKRIPGINVQYDQGEARFGQVRGTGADLTSVTVNGNRLPSAEGGTRNVQLDLIPADVIQTIEVNKVVTPDMDADAIGGSINLITKNAPTRRSFSATLGSGWNFVSDKAQLNAGLTYGDLFFDNKLGVILSASYQNAPIGSDNAEFVWKQDEETGEEWLDEYEVRQYIVTRERQSYTASLNYKFNENHRISFKGIYNLRKDWENRFRLDLKDLEPDGKGKAVIETKGGTRRNARLEKQQTMDFNLGGEHLLDFVPEPGDGLAFSFPHFRLFLFPLVSVAHDEIASSIKSVDGREYAIERGEYGSLFFFEGDFGRGHLMIDVEKKLHKYRVFCAINHTMPIIFSSALPEYMTRKCV